MDRSGCRNRVDDLLLENDPALDSDAYRRAVGAAVPIPAGMSANAADRCRIYHLHIIH